MLETVDEMRSIRNRERSKKIIVGGFAILLLLFLNCRIASGREKQRLGQAERQQAGDRGLQAQVVKLEGLVERLEKRVSDLEDRLNTLQTDRGVARETESSRLVPSVITDLSAGAGNIRSASLTVAPASATARTGPIATVPAPPAAEGQVIRDRKVLDFLHETTFNVTLDGYYEYNFDRPIGRVNLLRAYDVSSNSFSLNQAAIVIERAANPSEDRRFGVRLDLQYGQATETLQGSAANEPRPQVYRPLFQVYGTYVAPIGSGLTIDFGKWASALGIENNYTKDQFNYSRSLLFDFLPFYHMGVRASYNLTPRINVAYWLVNGAEQTEDFNGFKSQAFIFTLKPASQVTWNMNYYFGQEQRDVVPVLNPGLPTGPTQPGLPVQSITPVPNGRLHIFDSYVTWSATPRLTLAGEADYLIKRVFSSSAPRHDSGGAAYARYQFAPKFALAARAEYLSDRGGLFSGATQTLKETTLTAEYEFAEGFLVRQEWRRDFSNQPFFRTSAPGILKKEQNTATIGLVWWFGQKQGPW
jgi:hypothetical protein